MNTGTEARPRPFSPHVICARARRHVLMLPAGVARRRMLLVAVLAVLIVMAAFIIAPGPVTGRPAFA